MIKESLRSFAGVLSGYALALALVGVALGLSLSLEVRFGNPFWLLFPLAVGASNWFKGRGPGWLATGLSMVLVLYYFIPPLRSPQIRREDIPFALAFVLIQVLANVVVTWRKRTEKSLADANSALTRQIRERERAEESLQLARTELARVTRITTIGELAASIAHEVNQPIAAVVANADACVAWLNSERPDLIEAKSAASRAVQGATRASEVISRIRSLISNTPTNREPVDLNQVIVEMLALSGDQLQRNEIRVVTDLARNLPLVRADQIQLQQVIANLVSNGIEAMSQVSGRPRRLTVHTSMENDTRVYTSVADTGVGVATEAMAKLFEPFFTTRAQGIGMGLAISRSIVEAHGGRLWVESEFGQGSTFAFTIPVGAGEAG